MHVIGRNRKFEDNSPTNHTEASMRFQKILMGFALLVATFIGGTIFGKNGAGLTLPDHDFHVSSDGAWLRVHGRWTLVGEAMGWPTQTSTVECDKDQKVCVEGTAVISDGILMDVKLTNFKVDRWDAETVIATSNDMPCVKRTYVFDLRTKSANAVSKSECGGSKTEKRLTMRDGSDVR